MRAPQIQCFATSSSYQWQELLAKQQCCKPPINVVHAAWSSREALWYTEKHHMREYMVKTAQEDKKKKRKQSWARINLKCLARLSAGLRKFLLTSEELPGDAGCVHGHLLSWLHAVKKRKKKKELKMFAALRRVCPVNEMLHFRVMCCDLWRFEIPVMVRLSLCGDCVCQAMIEVANQYSPS